jgi:hypothetical protein
MFGLELAGTLACRLRRLIYAEAVVTAEQEFIKSARDQ